MKKENTDVEIKVLVRREVAVGPEDDVLDLFAGEGAMYRAVWCRAGRGATMDLEERFCARAARERGPGWTVLLGNAERAFRGGLYRERAFSVVDIDCYGAPWKFVRALFAHARRRPRAIVLTDNYMKHRNLSREDATLGFRKPGTVADYLAAVDRFLAATLPYPHARRTFRRGNRAQHLVTRTEPARDGSARTG